MPQQRIYNTLKSFADETYPGIVTPFKLEIYPKELSGKNGDYNPQTKIIRIFNMSRTTAHILETSIHELAHHVELCLHGKTGHGPTFYTILRDLNSVAIRKGYIAYKDINTANTSRSQGVLHKKHGDMLGTQKPIDISDGTYIIKVFKAFNIKDQLKDRGGYKWSDLEVAWCKELQEEHIEDEKDFLNKIHPPDLISVTESRDVTIEVVYHIIIPGAFEIRQQLKDRGYLFNGYGYTGNLWVRRLPAQNLGEEKLYLNSIGCTDFKIEGKKTKKPDKPKVATKKRK